MNLMLFYFQILLDIVQSIHRKIPWNDQTYVDNKNEWCLVIILWINGTRPDKKDFEQTPKKGKHPTLIVAKKIIDKM